MLRNVRKKFQETLTFFVLYFVKNSVIGNILGKFWVYFEVIKYRIFWKIFCKLYSNFEKISENFWKFNGTLVKF